MKEINIELQSTAGPGVVANNSSGDFYGFDGLRAAVPLSPRTLRELIKRGLIPHIRMKGGRRLIFHGPSVNCAVLRFQKGGIPE
jgi:hypothetical protein